MTRLTIKHVTGVKMTVELPQLNDNSTLYSTQPNKTQSLLQGFENLVFPRQLRNKEGFVEIKNKVWEHLPAEDPKRPILCFHSAVYENTVNIEGQINLIKKCFNDFCVELTKRLAEETTFDESLSKIESQLSDVCVITSTEETIQTYPQIRRVIRLYQGLSEDLSELLRESGRVRKSISPPPRRVAVLRDSLKLSFGPETHPKVIGSTTESKIIIDPKDVNPKLKPRGSARNVSKWDSRASRENIRASVSLSSLADQEDAQPGESSLPHSKSTEIMPDAWNCTLQ